MNIIIAGAGKVGFNLAKTLSIAHNVIVIDKNNEALNRIQEHIDIMPVCGSVEDDNTFKSLGMSEIDLFIAVTNIDNINLIGAITIDLAIKVKRKFIRLQKHYYDHQSIKEKLGIEQFIFPIQLASNTVISLLKTPQVNNIKTFTHTHYKLISVILPQDFATTTINFDKLKIIGIERNNIFSINEKESIELQANDLVYYFGEEKDLKYLINEPQESIKRCIIFGADKLGIAIANGLINMDCEVKLIEKDINLCHKADEKLHGKADIINFKYGSHEIFEEERIDSADIFISTTGNDEFNIIKCLEARDIGVKKVVAINNEMEYYNLMHSLNITAIRGPKMSAYHKIIEEISSSKVVLKKHFCGGKGTVFIRKIFEDMKKNIQPPKFLDSSVFYLLPNSHLIKFDTKININKDTLIIVFCTQEMSQKVQEWIYKL